MNLRYPSIVSKGASLLLACLGISSLSAQAPAWWTERGVINPLATPSDFSAVNSGQTLNMFRAAVDEFEEVLDGGAGSALTTLRAQLFTQTPNTSDFSAVNIGQLKNLAKPFYDRLSIAGISTGYPWDQSDGPISDFAMANSGQLKQLFSFDPVNGSAGSGIPTTDPGTNGIPKLAKTWGLFIYRPQMMNRADDYTVIVGTRHDLGFDWDYYNGGNVWQTDASALAELKADFPNAAIYWSVPWYSWFDDELGKIPGHTIRWGEDESGVGFDATMLSWWQLTAEIKNVTHKICQLGIAPMMDYCPRDAGNGHLQLMRDVRDIANSYGLKMMANVGDSGDDQVRIIPDVLDYEAVHWAHDEMDTDKWFGLLQTRRSGQEVYLRSWPSSYTEAQQIYDTYKGVCDLIQFEGIPDSVGNNWPPEALYHSPTWDVSF